LIANKLCFVPSNLGIKMLPNQKLEGSLIHLSG
jgi:hypothetical protein